METTTTVATANLPVQCLTYRLGDQVYALDILVIQEIRRFTQPTRLPDVSPFISGVMNLRGAVVPIFDLRVRFGLDAPVDRLTSVIVVGVGSRSVGLVVDEVIKVLRVPSEGVRAAPNLSEHVDSSFIVSLIPDGEDLVTLLDVAKLVQEEIGAG